MARLQVCLLLIQGEWMRLSAELSNNTKNWAKQGAPGPGTEPAVDRPRKQLHPAHEELMAADGMHLAASPWSTD
ncbi:hypothetical protein NQZ68_025811 [Dissostichus eleginoides]|nr:hypothetical protein NQZ68_025811 [Dissostichus eleginoides]